MVAVDAWFEIEGQHLPTLHGYHLYGALCRVQPEFHEASWWGLHTVHGRLIGNGLLDVPKGSRFGLRLPPERLALALALCGRVLDVGGHRLQVKYPEVRPLQPAASLSTRMVTIKGFQEADGIVGAVRRQLDDLAVAADIERGPRLVQRAGSHTIVGFALRLHGLNDEGSIRVMETGIGGRRRMGCGIFRPSIVGADEGQGS